MRRRDLLAAGAALAIPSIGRGAVASVLKFVPQADLANPDPIWTTATVARNHGYMVWDTLYGIDMQMVSHPQMCAGHQVSDDELDWTFTLRDGLLFHDGDPVRGVDCIASITRWSVRDPFGSQLAAATEEMRALDDKRFQIRLKRRFRQMLFALGAQGCFIMPERIAKTSAMEQIKDYVGSGPFVFKHDEWVAGSHAAYSKNTAYEPRNEAADYWSGGKVVHFDRVEWFTQPDPSVAAEALQKGEVDWIEFPLPDLLPLVKKTPGCDVVSFDPWGSMATMMINHLHPPFDNPKLLRALLPAVDQQEFVTAWVGDQRQWGKYPVGFFTEGAPMANKAGIEAFSAPRDIARAKQLVAESGYKGEKIALMSPSDQASLATLAQVTRDLFQRLGLNVDYQSMDWGTLVARRAKMESPAQGGWNVFCTTWNSLSVSNPGSSFPLRGAGKKGFIGWLDDPELERLRAEWFDAPDLAGQKAMCERIQARAFETVPFLPLGQWYYPWAVRSDLTGWVKCPQVLFYGVQRA